jgi:hypothetical protein
VLLEYFKLLKAAKRLNTLKKACGNSTGYSFVIEDNTDKTTERDNCIINKAKAE